MSKFKIVFDAKCEFCGDELDSTQSVKTIMYDGASGASGEAVIEATILVTPCNNCRDNAILGAIREREEMVALNEAIAPEGIER